MTPSRPLRVAAAIAGLAIATGAVAASQATAASPSTTIYACKAKKGGAVRVVTAKAKCGKAATKISWNTAGPAGAAGPTSPSIPGFTQNAGITLQPGAGWVTLGTVSLTASSAFRYQPTTYVERYSVVCPGSVEGTNSTSMNVFFRYVVNGVPIADNMNDDGSRKTDVANPAGLLQAWTGPVTMTVLARTTSYSYGTPAVPACALATGTVQLMAFAYSM